MSNDDPVPARGRLTFDAEGHEGGQYHSRKFHVPGPSSGLTIGRGYDMGSRSESSIRDDFIAAGLEPDTADLISKAAALKGQQAKAFITNNNLNDFEISKEVQLELFSVEYERQEKEARRLATKTDVTEKYGETDWDGLDPAIKDVLVDLKFRGDYTPACRQFLQKHVVSNDVAAVAQALADCGLWPGVPRDRFERRRDYCAEMLV